MLSDLKSVKDKPVVFANKQGVIIYVNQKFEHVFGWSADDIIGKLLTVIIPETFHDAHHLGFSRFQTTEQSKILSHPLRLQAVKKSGEVFAAEHTIYAEKVDGQWIFAATIVPVEE